MNKVYLVCQNLGEGVKVLHAFLDEQAAENKCQELNDNNLLRPFWVDELTIETEPPFKKGDRVYVHPAKMEATVIRQIKHYDQGDEFWGNLELEYDDGVKGTSHCWQVERTCTCHPDDNPPVPCAKQYALSECRRAVLDELANESQRMGFYD